MHGYDNIVIIIPAYNPDEKLLKHLRNIKEAGFRRVLLVNDGSEKNTEIFVCAKKEFGEGLIVLKHSVNLGQGRAYKTALNYYIENYRDTLGVVECDADGQHHIDDVRRCADLLIHNPEKFILGVRNFDQKGIPFRSRFGNKLTNFMFRFFCGMRIKDTQTGLKGFPYELAKKLISVQGERYEYATSVLLEVNKGNIPICQFDIQTIYINNNESSHFNPLIDSLRIYSLLLKYLISALSAFIIDIVFFSVFVAILGRAQMEAYIIVSTYMAKVLSCTYSFFVNRKLVFHSNEKLGYSGCKYMLLCAVQASLSGFITDRLFLCLHYNEVLLKILVDSVLFFLSFTVQQKWVFAKTGESENGN